MKKLALAIATVACITMCGIAGVSAATPTGVSVNPALKNLTVQPNQSSISFPATLENDTKQAIIVTPTAVDFEATGTNGSIRLKADPDANHGLMDNLSFSEKSFSLGAGKNHRIQVTVTHTDRLAPGGHFALIRYSIIQQTPSDTKSSIGIKSEISTFVFLVTGGKTSYGVWLQTSVPKLALWQTPSEIDLLFTNTANTQTAPRGFINISGPFHSQVTNDVINPDSSLVLPGSTRLLQTKLRSLQTALWPGRYHMDIYYRAQENAGYQHVQQSYVYIGWPAIVFGLYLVAMAVWGRRLWRKHQKHRRDKA